MTLSTPTVPPKKLEKGIAGGITGSDVALPSQPEVGEILQFKIGEGCYVPMIVVQSSLEGVEGALWLSKDHKQVEWCVKNIFFLHNIDAVQHRVFNAKQGTKVGEYE